jgi:RNA polymerase sigma-70 factor, ECF subfamily
VSKERKRAGAAAPLDQVRRSIYSDLQYVSLQVDGKDYGGWYRLLSDGRMELLALANMHCERRSERTPIEQARGMLAEFIRAAREHEPSGPQTTIGDLLYADKTKSRVSEHEWVGLVRSMAAGDPLALDELFERTHRIVFTLMMRLLGDREVAEELTLDVFHDVWRQASHFDAAGGPVLSWLLGQARLRAIERLQMSAAAHLKAQSASLQDALPVLSASERQLIETAYFSRLACRELAAEQQQTVEAVQGHIHSALEKLREKLATGLERR